MRHLTIVRHAEAAPNMLELRDFDRPLTDRGRRDAAHMACWMRETISVAEGIISSPALRALTTAGIFADTLGIAEERFQTQARIYSASLSTLLRLLRGFDNHRAHVLLFGHNPGVSELAHALARCPFDGLPPCGVAHLELPAAHWQDIAEHSGTLLLHMFPGQLPER